MKSTIIFLHQNRVIVSANCKGYYIASICHNMLCNWKLIHVCVLHDLILIKYSILKFHFILFCAIFFHSEDGKRGYKTKRKIRSMPEDD